MGLTTAPDAPRRSSGRGQSPTLLGHGPAASGDWPGRARRGRDPVRNGAPPRRRRSKRRDRAGVAQPFHGFRLRASNCKRCSADGNGTGFSVTGRSGSQGGQRGAPVARPGTVARLVAPPSRSPRSPRGGCPACHGCRRVSPPAASPPSRLDGHDFSSSLFLFQNRTARRAGSRAAPRRRTRLRRRDMRHGTVTDDTAPAILQPAM